MKALKSFLCLVKIAAKDKIDIIVMALFILTGVVDLFTSYDLTGGLLFFAVYTFAALLRMAWWKLQAIKNIKDEQIREELGLTESPKEC